jgi:hypothetical protein
MCALRRAQGERILKDEVCSSGTAPPNPPHEGFLLLTAPLFNLTFVRQGDDSLWKLFRIVKDNGPLVIRASFGGAGVVTGKTLLQIFGMSRV